MEINKDLITDFARYLVKDGLINDYEKMLKSKEKYFKLWECKKDTNIEALQQPAVITCCHCGNGFEQIKEYPKQEMCNKCLKELTGN